jgi:hypothetical protein
MIRPRFFHPTIEMGLKVVIGVVMISAFLVTLAWGYAQRQRAEEWRETACTYRMAELTRKAPFLASAEDQPTHPCERLDVLGVSLQHTN